MGSISVLFYVQDEKEERERVCVNVCERERESIRKKPTCGPRPIEAEVLTIATYDYIG